MSKKAYEIQRGITPDNSTLMELYVNIAGEYEWMMTASDRSHDEYDMDSDIIDHTAIINDGQQDQMLIIGFKKKRALQVLEVIIMVITCGLSWLVSRWLPSYRLRMIASRCSLFSSDIIMIMDQYKQKFVQPVFFITSKTFIQRRFIFKKVIYIWEDGKFIKLRGINNVTYDYFHEAKPFTTNESLIRKEIYGANFIEIHVTSIIRLLRTQILNPFYIFQVFSIILWWYDEYIYYAACIAFISIISLFMEIYQTRTMERSLKNTVTSIMTVHRLIGDQENDQYEEILADSLVPGDIIMVPKNGCKMSCDAVLLTGNCIVNESMLTGESVPVTKTAIPESDTLVYCEENKGQLSKYTLSCGTEVLQGRYYGNKKVRAVVVRTGFMTSKGELVRSIMFPKPVDFKFTQDSYKFVGILGLLASVGMVYTLIIMAQRSSTVEHMITRTLDIITIVIPPALPAAMTAGIVFAQRRLRANLIYCICPSAINVCGSIDTVCFDKTGTLTEDGLDMKEIIASESANFIDYTEDNIEINIAMASCHSLTRIDNVLVGDPLDLKMFEYTNWLLEEPGDDESKFDVFMPTVVRSHKLKNFEVGILRQIQFDSREQRMSVIVKRNYSSEDHPFELFCKGAPEKIASLCLPETVPDNFHKILQKYTSQGYRVIALSKRDLKKFTYVKLQRIEREQLEIKLEFLGLMILENRLKPKTCEVIKCLNNANLRSIMITGDNILTALAIGRECGMVPHNESVVSVHAINTRKVEWTYADDVIQNDTIDINELENYHFAMTGNTFSILQKYHANLLHKIIVRGSIFARMSPDQKQQLIEMLQAHGNSIAMCGDGANDCGALKTANAGISLSDSEASVAAPFTSKVPDISCIPTVIREGRAALVTSFGIFKFMAGYSLTQFTTVCLLYWIDANLTDFQFLYIDLFVLTTLCITFGYTRPTEILTSKLPEISLISIKTLCSVSMQIIAMFTIQMLSWILVQKQSWYIPYVINEDDDYASYEVTALFLVSNYQYIIIAFVFSKGYPYRRPIYTNYFFLVNLILCLTMNIYLSLNAGNLESILEMVIPPVMSFRFILLGISLANFIICYSFETLLDTNICDSLNKNNLHNNKEKDIELCINVKGYFSMERSTSEFSELLTLENMISVS